MSPDIFASGQGVNEAVSEGVSEDLRRWSDSKKFPLLEHQLVPIDYLEKNTDIKGLLLYHYLGTGKTFLSLGFAERNQDQEVLILVPDFLVTHWKKNIDLYGVTNRDRYRIVTHNSPEFAVNSDLSNTIVIIDESHRIVNKLSSLDTKTSEKYTDLYLNLRNAHRILSLTGTPVHSSTLDLAYQINLVSGEDLLPFNNFQFNKDFTLVNQGRSLLRGHMMESALFPIAFTIGAYCSSSFMPWYGAIAVGIGATFFSSIVTQVIKSYYPIDKDSFRRFNVTKLDKVAAKYISHYDFDRNNNEDYPSKAIYEKEAGYNSLQLAFLIKFANNALNARELLQMQLDEPHMPNPRYIAVNGYRIQKNMKQNPMAGVSIGNMFFKSGSTTLYPQKFEEVLKIMESTDRPVAIYSNFYHNGIITFKRYLDLMGHEGEYKVLDPRLPGDEYEKIISDYNEGNVRFLLIHPDITEGISLKGTAQMHILEPCPSAATQEQIMGRVVRYQSHTHLPIEQRHVDIYLWKQVIPSLSLEYMIALRRDWLENFPELNYYGIRPAVDDNAFMKNSTPDARAYDAMLYIDRSVESLVKLIKVASIESNYR